MSGVAPTTVRSSRRVAAAKMTLATFLAIAAASSLMPASSDAFAPPLSAVARRTVASRSRPAQLHPTTTTAANTPAAISSELCAVTKQQTAIFDGAEMAYLVATLVSNEGEGGRRDPLPNVAPRSISKKDRVACMSFATGTVDENRDGGGGANARKRVVGVVVANANETTPSSSTEKDPISTALYLGGSTYIYKDSVATIPDGVSDADAISTAAAALVGVHCAAPPPSSKRRGNKDGNGRTVVVGGGDYAQFLAKGLGALGVDVSLVTARPSWGIDKSIGNGDGGSGGIRVMAPAVGKLQLGFATAVGEFDSIVDTLGDETGLGRARNIVEDEMDFAAGRDTGFLGELRHLHGCEKYISTVTRSQQYVQLQGLFFARDTVLRYQNEVEKRFPSMPSAVAHNYLLPPPGYGTDTLQKLLDARVVYPADKNEVGAHADKDAFVRGWSLSDLHEEKTWPRDGAARFGFPTVETGISSHVPRKRTSGSAGIESSSAPVTAAAATAAASSSALEDVVITKIASDDIGTVPHPAEKERSSPPRHHQPHNPFVADVASAACLNEDIVEPELNCVLFVTASYCRSCKVLQPKFTRLARLMSEAHGKDKISFAKVDIASGARGKQLSRILDVEKVPSVLLFHRGERVGKPLDVKSFPSKELDAAIEALCV